MHPSRLSHLFKACVCMEDGPAKPDPFPVAQAAKLIGVDPKDTALVRCISCLLCVCVCFLYAQRDGLINQLDILVLCVVLVTQLVFALFGGNGSGRGDWCNGNSSGFMYIAVAGEVFCAGKHVLLGSPRR